MDRTARVILLAELSSLACAQSSPTKAELKVSGGVSTPLTLSVGDLKKMPRETLSVMNPHEKKTETYEGVLQEEILHRAGVPQGESLRGRAMASYVVAEAEDGYRVVFSMAELDSGILDSEVIVADTVDGSPLGAKQGPFRPWLPTKSGRRGGSECSSQLRSFALLLNRFLRPRICSHEATQRAAALATQCARAYSLRLRRGTLPRRECPLKD